MRLTNGSALTRAPQQCTRQPLQARTGVCGVSGRARRATPRQLVARAQDQGGDADSRIEELFAEELKRRGMGRSSMDGDAEPSAAQKDASTTKTASKSPFAGGGAAPRSGTGSGGGARGPLPPPDAGATDGQRARSMALVSEGLEGLIPRATELIKLGGSVFLAFIPFMVAISLLFSGLYFVFGEHLLHGGTSRSGPPSYVDPATLLSEPTVDPFVPYN